VSMADKIATLVPEIIMLGTAFIVMIVGLSPNPAIRRGTAWLSAAALFAAGAATLFSDQLGLPAVAPVAMYVKLAIIGVGLLLLGLAAENPSESNADMPNRPFDVSIVSRGEFYGFFLLSLVGAMLCVSAGDLIWLFLALELTSLPTYVMVAISRDKIEAPEAGVKYFFLGAFAAAIFLYGFALLYGATGTTMFTPLGGGELIGITKVFAEQGINTLGLLGLLLAIAGIAFKIAAVPMHVYAADVYQGAATPVTAFLAFVPKTAGFIALLAVLATIGWPLDAAGQYGQAIVWLLWVMAVATMFLGNTMALRQTNVKRVLAYSSIAHTGYMLVGVVAGPVGQGGQPFVRNGIAAVLFYLVIYGIMNAGAFGVLGILKSKGEEAETYDDIAGLARRHPALAAVMAVCVFALAGLPPIIGFWGKLYLVGAAISAGYIWLVVLLVIASAIGAVYYLRIIGACFLPAANESTEQRHAPVRYIAAVAAAVLVIVLSIGTSWLLQASHNAADWPTPTASSFASVPATR
jgi:NADH-quinone oxidoreductase subunit N